MPAFIAFERVRQELADLLLGYVLRTPLWLVSPPQELLEADSFDAERVCGVARSTQLGHEGTQMGTEATAVAGRGIITIAVFVVHQVIFLSSAGIAERE